MKPAGSNNSKLVKHLREQRLQAIQAKQAEGETECLNSYMSALVGKSKWEKGSLTATALLTGGRKPASKRT